MEVRAAFSHLVRCSRALKGPPPHERKNRATPSACARGLNYTKLSPSSSWSPQGPAQDKATSLVHGGRSNTARVDNFDYQHQRARDSREKLPRRRESDEKTYFLEHASLAEARSKTTNFNTIKINLSFHPILGR
ncbi:hypothetical protein EVAR_71343_1, partial [Eumeta japonica]